VTLDRSFPEVIRACAARDETWISEEIIAAYTELSERGYAHSFETRTITGDLVGGLYGVAIGRAFFGESMFSRERDASKVALVHLVQWMGVNGFTLLDTQYLTPHLQSLGAREITKEEYNIRLAEALA
jgi:leucyl/phenylalanyl-tRNA--protein transferase